MNFRNNKRGFIPVIMLAVVTVVLVTLAVLFIAISFVVKLVDDHSGTVVEEPLDFSQEISYLPSYIGGDGSFEKYFEVKKLIGSGKSLREAVLMVNGGEDE